jgi:hypothetical protein
MSRLERREEHVSGYEEPTTWKRGPDIELEVRMQPGDVLARISDAVASDRLALQRFDRLSEHPADGRIVAERFVFHVAEGAMGMNAFSLVCEGKVEPSKRGSSLALRFHTRSLARLFLFVWSTFVFLVGVYEVLDAWPQLPSWRMLGVTSTVSVLVIVLFMLAKRYSRHEERRMRALLKELFADSTLSVRERPVAGRRDIGGRLR